MSYFLGFSFLSGAVYGIIKELEELTVIVAVPLVLGLVWNRWAGGASGFLMGSLFALYWSDRFANTPSGGHFSAGPVLLGYVISAMLIGYMAGALNKRSEDLRRMIITGVLTTTIGGLTLFGIYQLSSTNIITGFEGFALTVLPRILCGVLIPLLAKLLFLYGMGVNRKSSITIRQKSVKLQDALHIFAISSLISLNFLLFFNGHSMLMLLLGVFESIVWFLLPMGVLLPQLDKCLRNPYTRLRTRLGFVRLFSSFLLFLRIRTI